MNFDSETKHNFSWDEWVPILTLPQNPQYENVVRGLRENVVRVQLQNVVRGQSQNVVRGQNQNVVRGQAHMSVEKWHYIEISLT